VRRKGRGWNPKPGDLSRCGWERARIVLLAASGQPDKEIAASMAITPKKVSRWRKRFLALGVAGLLKDAHRPGRKPTIGARLTKRVVTHDHAPAT